MQKKILLISIGPPGISGRAWLALGCLKAYAEQANKENKNEWDIQTAVFESKSIAFRKKVIQEVSDHIKQKAPVLVGFSCYMWNIAAVCDIAAALLQSIPDIKILFGGPQINEHWIESRNPEKIPAHYLALGEGEKIFSGLLSHLSTGFPRPENINGLAFRNDIESPFHEAKLLIPSDDYRIYPSPYRTPGIIPEDEYDNPNFLGMLETQRGCTFRCSYCLYNKLVDTRIKYRAIDDVVADIEFLAARNVKILDFVDANFTSDVEYSCKILKGILSADTKDIWMINTTSNPGSINQTLLSLYEEFMGKRPGNIVMINLGLQTTNPETLRLIRRPRDLTKISEDFLLMTKHGCFVKLDVIIGLPGDSLDDIDRTLDFCFDLFLQSENHTFTPQILNMLPGTDIVDTTGNYGIDARKPFYDASEYAVPEVYQTKALPRVDFVKAVRKTAVAFRLANGEGWAKWPHYSKVQRTIPRHDVRLRNQFLAARTKHSLKNSELISIITEKLVKHLEGTPSSFINPEFPLPEFWWLSKGFEEVKDEWFLNICSDLAK